MLRYLLLFVIALHGVIQLIGFIAGFELLHLNAFTGKTSIPLSKTGIQILAILWLVAAFLFLAGGIMYIAHRHLWYWVLGIALLLSQVLIIIYWADAKAGTIANLIILIPVIIAFADNSFYRNAEVESKNIIAKASGENIVVTADMMKGVPYCVQNWLLKSGVVGKPMVHTAYLRQRGYMCIKPGGKYMPAEAEQYFNIDEPSFVWTVKVNMMPGVLMTGRDKYEDGKGNMLIKLYSLFTFANGRGEAINQGTMLRYLGEICWFPSAALMPYIQWEEVNALSAKATMTYKGVTASAIFTFDEDGKLITTDALRYMGMGADASLQSWHIPVTAWKIFQSIRVPSAGNAIWKLSAGDYNYYKWEITDIQYNPTDVSRTVLAD